MALPTRATAEDILQTCPYLATKPTGATIQELRGVLAKLADSRRLSALRYWGLVDQTEDAKYRLTELGRSCAKGDAERAQALQQVIRNIPSYLAIIERAAHRQEDSLSSADVASHWYDHFRGEVGESDRSITQQAVCFFHVAEGADLGTLVIGRRGAPTRFSFSVQALAGFVGRAAPVVQEPEPTAHETRGESERAEAEQEQEKPDDRPQVTPPRDAPRGRGIFIAHGKCKKPLEQPEKILDQFKIPYKIAIDEPNLGRPISGKIRDIMESCNCAILIFTADEEFRDKDGNTIWRPSENVVYELGASGYLYDNRIVIMKEKGVTFPTNFRDIGYIEFDKDKLEAKAIEVLKELIGFGMVKVSA